MGMLEKTTQVHYISMTSRGFTTCNINYAENPNIHATVDINHVTCKNCTNTISRRFKKKVDEVTNWFKIRRR